MVQVTITDPSQYLYVVGGAFGVSESAISSIQIVAIPEPSTYAALLGLGALGLIVLAATPSLGEIFSHRSFSQRPSVCTGRPFPPLIGWPFVGSLVFLLGLFILIPHSSLQMPDFPRSPGRR